MTGFTVAELKLLLRLVQIQYNEELARHGAKNRRLAELRRKIGSQLMAAKSDRPPVQGEEQEAFRQSQMRRSSS